MKKSASSESSTTSATPTKTPALNTWWVRNCNQKRYFLRQIHEFCGRTFVWIYQEGVNRCYHLPLSTLHKRYSQLPVGPVNPANGNTRSRLN
jgi:hypothetical protein